MSATQVAHESGPQPIAGVVWLSILAACFAGLSALYFLPWAPHVMFGDDLANYGAFLRGELASTPWQALTQSSAEKYRPVFALTLGALFAVLGQNVAAYMLVNLVLNGASGAVAAAIAFKLSGGRRLIALFAAAMLVNSRFALYQVTQITGLLEATGYLLFLTMVLGVVHLIDCRAGPARRLRAGLVLALVAEWLLIFTHERYLPVAPWLAAVLVLSPTLRSLSPVRRLALAALSIAPAVLNTAYKTLVLKDAMLVGTGGTHIGFDPATIVLQVLQAALTLAGFNYGPDYLAGRSSLGHLSTVDGALTFAYFVLLAVIAVIGAVRAITTSIDWRDRLMTPGALLTLAALVLVPPIMTIRMEQRWLLEPQALIVLTLAWCVGKIALRHARTAVMLFAAFAITSLVLDWRMSRYFPNIFFVQSGEIADVVNRDIIHAEPGPQVVTIVAGPDICSWVLQQDAFFQMYGDPGESAQCINAVDDFAPSAADIAAKKKVYLLSGDDPARDITAAAYRAVSERSEFIKRDFVRLYGSGRIDNSAKVDTPTGTGAFILPIDTPIGPADALTVISGFSYVYDHIRASPGDHLKFDAAMVYPTKEPARALVKIIQAGKPPATVYSAILPVRAQDGLPVSVAASLLLGDYAGDISIAFSVETPGADSTAHWVAFSRPRIVGVPGDAGAGPRLDGGRGAP